MLQQLSASDFTLLAAKNNIDPLGPRLEESFHAQTQALIATHLNRTLYANRQTRQQKDFSARDFMRVRKKTKQQKSTFLLNGLRQLAK